MREYLPFVVVGLTTGGVYALASLGLVLTYTTSGVFNFAHGAVGMFATYLFYSLRVDVGVPTALAAAVAVVVIAPLMGIAIDRVLLRRLDGATAATYVVASLGLLVALQALAAAIYGGGTRRISPLLPTGTYRLPGVNVGVDQTIVVGIAVAAGVGLIVFFKRTRLGLQTRAVVGDRTLTGLVGTNAAAVTTFSWMLGCAFAALSGILFAPLIGLDSVLLTLLVVEAFGAAVVGRLRSFPVTMAAAFGLGVGQGLLTKLVADLDVRGLAGLPSSLPFIVLFAVLVFSRKGSFVEVTRARPTGGRRRVSGLRLRTRLPLFAAAVGGAALLPSVLGDAQLLTATTTVAFVLIFVSLSLLVGLSRQVSLAHAVFVVFGATTLSHLQSAGVPWLLALLIAALLMVPIGAVLAIPAIRLSGLFLALATFGFGVLAQNLLFSTGLAFGADAVVNVRRPSLFGSDASFFFVVLAVVVAGVIVVEVVRVTRLGRILQALADSPTAMQSLGVNPTASRVLAFCLSAFLAALAGGLLGTQIQSLTTFNFNFFQSLIWVAVLVTAGPQNLVGSVLAAVLLVTVPAVFTSSTVAEWQPVFFGVAAMVLAQAPNGLAGLVRRPDFAALRRRSQWRDDDRRALERYVTTIAASPNGVHTPSTESATAS